MSAQIRNFMKKDKLLTAVIAAELAALIVLLTLCFSLILQSVGDANTGIENTDAVGLFVYLGLACLLLYFFTVAVGRIIHARKNREYYGVCVSLGGTKRGIFVCNLLKNALIYGGALIIGLVVLLPLIEKNKDDAGLRFFTYAGLGIAAGVYLAMFAAHAASDYVSTARMDFLKQIREETDHE